MGHTKYVTSRVGTFTLHRRGEFTIPDRHTNKCNLPAWQAFQYVVSVRALDYLDAKGFVIDHNEIHENILKAIQSGANGSCEELCRELVASTEGCCSVNGTVVTGMHVKVRPKPTAYSTTMAPYLTRPELPHSWTEYDVVYSAPLNFEKTVGKRRA